MGHECSQRQVEEFYDPAREDNILRRNKTQIGVVGGTLQGPNCCAGQSLKVWWKVSTEESWLEAVWKQGSNDRRLCGVRSLPLWEEVLWPFLDALDSVRLRTTSTQWNVPGR